MNLNRGINLGGWLSQCNHTKERYDTFITKEDIARIASWGCDHIRLPFDFNLIEDKDGNEIPEGYKYLDNAISWCTINNLNIILDLHKAAGYDFNNAESDSPNTLFNNEDLQKRFLNLWDKLSKRYGNINNVAFELLNEVVEEDVVDAWNNLISKTIKTIRKNAPESKIIYGGVHWNSARTVKFLEKPQDENIILTFHFYEPLIFTHQKARWVTNMIMDQDIKYPESMKYFTKLSKVLGYKGKDVTDSNSKENGDKLIRDMVNEAVESAKKLGASLYCGEFGVIDQAPAQDTLNWFNDVLSIFEEHNIGCSIWSYKQMSFGLIDKHYDPIRKDLLTKYTHKVQE